MSFRLDPPHVYVADEGLRDVYAYLTRIVNGINYAFGFLDVPAATAAGGSAAAESAENKAIRISGASTNLQYPSAKAVFDFAVPQTRTINGLPLTEDLTLTAEDLGAVPETRKINGHALGEDLTLTPEDLGADDYVEKAGSDNAGWRWRKWHGGAVEMIAAAVPVSLGAWSSVTNDLYAASGNISYPVTLAAADAAVQVTAAGTTQAVVYGVSGKTTSGAAVTVLRPDNTETGIAVDVYVCGRWK